MAAAQFPVAVQDGRVRHGILQGVTLPLHEGVDSPHIDLQDLAILLHDPEEAVKGLGRMFIEHLRFPFRGIAGEEIVMTDNFCF